MSKKRYIINFAVIIVLAVVSGYFIGSYIAQGKLVELSNTYNELELRGLDNKLDMPNYYSELLTDKYGYGEVINNLKGKDYTKLTAIEAFMLAEHNTNTSSYVVRKVDGTIKAKSMGVNVNQSLTSTKTVKDGKIYLDKISYSSMAKVAMKVEHTIGEATYTYTKGTATSGTEAKWESPETKQLGEYRKTFGSGIDYFSNYLVSDKTVNAKQMSRVEKAGNNYKFSLALNIQIDEKTGKFIYGGVSNYMYEVKATAGADSFPVFAYCNLSVIVDSNFRFVQVDINEQYNVVAFGFNANTTSVMIEKYSYTQNVE